jgi:hypothetical protein
MFAHDLPGKADRRRGTALALITGVSRIYAEQEMVMSLITKTSVLAAMFLGLFAGSARAQEGIVAKVPFPFVVNGKEFPAGRYAITQDDSALEIVGMDNPSAMVMMTTSADGRDPAGSQPALVFVHYPDEYLLSQVWESTTWGLKLPERSIVSRHAEAQPAAPEGTTVVAANWK